MLTKENEHLEKLQLKQSKVTRQERKKNKRKLIRSRKLGESRDNALKPNTVSDSLHFIPETAPKLVF